MDDYDIPAFQLNHPKNYLGVPVAEAADGDTGALVSRYVVGACGSAKRGAQALDLLDADGDLTAQGEDVADHAARQNGTLDEALEQFDDWKRTRTRFIELAPSWEFICRFVITRYSSTLPIQNALFEEPAGWTLAGLVQWLYRRHPEYTADVFLSRDVPDNASWRDLPVEDAEAYRGAATFQFKNLLYHCGIVTEPGAEIGRLDPTEDYWQAQWAADREGEE